MGLSFGPGLTVGHECPILPCVRGNEFIRRIQVYAKKRGISCEWRPDLGKGSHGVLIFGSRRTVVRNPKDELKTGALHGMLRQLGLTLKDI